jgi:hypothetical protein
MVFPEGSEIVYSGDLRDSGLEASANPGIINTSKNVDFHLFMA